MSSLSRFTFTLAFSLLFLNGWAQPAAQQQAILLKRMIEKHHYAPRPVNDSFSATVFSAVVSALDPQHSLLLAEDYNRLAAHRYRLDDELQGGSWAFTDLATSLYRQGLKRKDSVINALLQKPLDLTADETITFTRDKNASYAATITELRNRWNKWLKLQLLYHAYSLQEAQTTRTTLKDIIAKNETLLRQKLKKSSGLQTGTDDPSLVVKKNYLHAVSTAFDPHSLFFSPDEKAEFQAALSTEQASFGFVVDEKEGKVVIGQLLPGGPAWKSGNLHRNDQVLQLRFGNKEPIDAGLLSAEEVEEALQTSEPLVTVKVKKANGLVEEVTLRSEKIEIEENSVKGYVIKGDKKIGYISLPDFYTTWAEESGSGCASDVAKAIVHLKKEGIDGLILDVRYNGGGSLEEALELAGIFIEEGPLLGVQDRNRKIGFLKDPNRGTIWDGPMVLLINGQSASASEMLAATLQDYNRAVIVGSTSYGKATMQAIYPMDSTTSDRMVTSSNGYVKITTGKLYRLNGGTAQQLGVVPDIHLPDPFDALEYKERFSPGALPPDSVKRNAYYKPLAALPVKELAVLSEKRVGTKPHFVAIEKGIKQYAEAINAKKQVIPLKPEAFEKWVAANEKAERELSTTAESGNALFAVINHGGDGQRLQNNAYASELNSHIIKNLQVDIYIEEALQVLKDLISKTSK